LLYKPVKEGRLRMMRRRVRSQCCCHPEHWRFSLDWDMICRSASAVMFASREGREQQGSRQSSCQHDSRLHAMHWKGHCADCILQRCKQPQLDVVTAYWAVQMIILSIEPLAAIQSASQAPSINDAGHSLPHRPYPGRAGHHPSQPLRLTTQSHQSDPSAVQAFVWCRRHTATATAPVGSGSHRARRLRARRKQCWGPSAAQR
jgi:hypothetical protein